MSEIRRRRTDAAENTDDNRTLESTIREPILDGTPDGGTPEDDSPAAVAVKDRMLATVKKLQFGATYFGVAFLIWILGYFGFSILWLIMGVSTYTWRKYRQEQKKIASQVLDNIADDEQKYFKALESVYKLSGKELPSWVYFPDVEKAEWLNKVIEQMWPYVGRYVQNLIFEKIEPSIRQSNDLLKGFSFSKFDLGDKAPRFSGVKVYGSKHTRRSEIVMDLQLAYKSDTNIRVTLNKLNVLSVGIKDLSIRGLIRVELRPLINEIPLFGAVTVSFVDVPSIDFDLTDLGNFFDIPGLDSVLHSTIADVVSSMMVLPERYVLKLADDVDVSRIRFPMPEGVLRVHVLEARNLLEKDKKILGFGGGSDPYVVVKVGRDKYFQTGIVHKNLNPVWNERFQCPVSELRTSKVEVTLYDDDGALNEADFLGSASIPMATIYNNGVVDEWIPLSEVAKGEVHIKMEWMELSADPSLSVQAMEEAGKYDLDAAFLNLYIDSAKHLPDGLDAKYEPSPAVKVKFNFQDTPFKTKVVEESVNPVWEENFQTLVSYLQKETVSLQVTDGGNDDDVLGKLEVKLKDVLRAPDMTMEQSFSLKDSGPHSKLHLRACLRLLIPKNPSLPGENLGKSAFSVAEPNRKARDDGSRPSTSSIPTLIKPEEKSTSVDNHPTTEPGKERNDSDAASTATDELNFANSPSFRGRDRNTSLTGSTASELSAFDESRDPRNRNASNANEARFGRLRLKISYSEKHEKLSVEIWEAENLIVCDDDNNTSDPYVRIYLHRRHRSTQKKKTKVVKNDLNPVFKETLEFDLERSEVREQRLDIAVKNKTGLLSSEKALMGQLMIDLRDYDFSKSQLEWYTLKIFEKEEH